MRAVVAAVLFALALPAAAQMPDFASVMRSESAAVVTVRVPRSALAAEAEDADEDELAESLRRFFEPEPPGRSEGSLGSGFVLAEDGLIVTSGHLVASRAARDIVVQLADRRELPARVIGVDVETDVALIKVEARGLQPARLGDPGRLQVGEWVAAIGAPFGFERSLTVGVVSAVGRTLPEQVLVPFVQTDVAVNPGNSGGPLFNARGEVVAVNSLTYSETGGYMGVSFAVPVDVVARVAEALRSRGRVTRGAVAMRVQDLTPPLAAALGAAGAAGALVTDVYRDGPAGVRPGDIVVRYGGRSVESSAALLRLIADTPPGATVPVELLREGARAEARLAVEERQAFEPRRGAGTTRAPPPAAVDRLGLVLAEIAPPERERLGLASGLAVRRAEGDSRQAGLRRGDIVISVNNRAVASLADFRQALAASRSGYAALLVQRGTLRLFVALPAPG